MNKKETKEKKLQLDPLHQSFLVKYGVAFLAFVLIILGWYFVYFRDAQSQMNRYASQISDWMQKLRTITVSQDAIDGLEADIQKMKEEIEAIERKVYHIEEIREIARQLVVTARSYRLKVISIVPSYDVLFPVEQPQGEQKPLVKLPIEIEMTGRFVNAGRFIEKIPELPFALAPNGVEFHSDPNIYPRLRIVLRGYLFLLNEPKSTGKSRIGD